MSNGYMVGNAPNYAAPLSTFGLELGKQIASLPQQYYQGQENARTVRIQNAFAGGGVPMTSLPDGTQVPNLGAVLQTYARLGADPSQISSLADSVVRQQQYVYDRNSQPLIGGQPPAPPANETPVPGDAGNGPSTAAPLPRPTSNDNAAGPMNVRGPQNTPSAQPQVPTVGTDGAGSDTVRTIVAEHYGPRQDASVIIPRVASAFKVDPDAPLTPQQAQGIRSSLAQASGSASPGQAGLAPAPGSQTPAAGVPTSTGPAPAPAAPTGPATSTSTDPAADPAAFLKSQGIVPNDRSMAAVRLFGPQAAARFISGISNNPRASAASLFDPAFVKANPQYFYDQNSQPLSAVGLFAKLTPVQSPASTLAGNPQSPVAALMRADPTLGGLAPANYPGGTTQYLNDLYKRAGGPMSPDMRKLFQSRIGAIQDYIAKNGGLTNDQKEWLAGAQPGETQIEYEARAAGAKAAATAPYDIAKAAVRQGGRPISIAPNDLVTTGNQINPALQGITDWAAKKVGIPSPGAASPPTPSTAPATAASGQATTTQPALPGPVQNPTPVPNNAPPIGQSAFTPRMIRNPDGSVTSSVTPGSEEIQKAAAADYEQARTTYDAAQSTKQTLALMEDSFRTLNQSGWSSTGAGAQARLELAKGINSVWQVLGVPGQNLPFDPNTIASWEDLTKNSTRLGFSLARTLGAREAMQIVQGAIKANPSIENTPTGARMVLNAIRQNAERDSDYYTFATQYAQTHGGDLVGADVAFNRANPAALYARRAIVQAQRDIPQEAIEALRSDPTKAAQFDQHFGAKGLSKLFLGNQ